MKGIDHRGMYEEEFTFPQTYNTYSEYKDIREQSELRYLIHRKYLKLLGHFIDTMYPGLRFDILIKHRNDKERKPDWYGMTYMELIVFDVISSPVYNPNTFEPSYRTPHCGEHISGQLFFNDFESYLPDINKHLLITFIRCSDVPMNIMEYNMLDIPSFECWRQYYIMERRDNTYRGHFS